MTATRILLFDVPHLLRDMLVREVDEAPDMDLVGELCDGKELVAMARSTQPDFIVVSVDDGEVPAACQQVFREQPLIRVLGLIADAGHLYLHELRPGRQDIGYVRPAEIVYTIRGAASRPSLI
jgi:DNA-binding NarL/FixJ family response regulator